MKEGSCDVSAIEAFEEVFNREVAIQVLQSFNWMLSNNVGLDTLFHVLSPEYAHHLFKRFEKAKGHGLGKVMAR